MIFESPTARLMRAVFAIAIIAAAHGAAIAYTLLEPDVAYDESQAGGAFVIELANVTTSPEDEQRDVAIGAKSDEIAPVAASVAQKISASENKPLNEQPVVPEATEPPPEDALVKPPEDKVLDDVKPREAKLAQAVEAVAQAAVAANEAAAPQRIENALKATETPTGKNIGLSRLDRRAIDNWQRDLVVHLNRHKRYPAKARDERQHGVVNVAFTMDRDGRVLEAKIASSSGYEMLDTAAIAMLNKASPLPIPPMSMSGESIDLVVPVNYRWRE